ncbi:FAD-dependent oxidoreductase [Lachnospiraceae bacterium LCP25S3_G4]
MKVIIVGGGWSGCAAAVEAKKSGAEVALLERTDMLLGTGLVGGIMRNNGRFTATEEMIAMGGGDMFHIIDQNLRHKNVEFPGHEHADLYNIGIIEGAVYRYIVHQGIKVKFNTRIVHVEMQGENIQSISDDNQIVYRADVFIDATGTAGPMNQCGKYGNGCAMCVLRCPSFGGRVSFTGLTGVKEIQGKKRDGTIGSMSGSCKLYKESLAPHIVEALNKHGVLVIPLPKQLQEDHLEQKSCQQYALPEYKENLILLDTGHGKLMMPFFSLEKLHLIAGFENARYEDPYAGGKGNSMRYFAMAPRDNALQVTGVCNLFCAGEKSGLMVGHTEAIVTGVLAGYNAVRFFQGNKPLILSRDLAVGDMIAYVNEEMQSEKGLGKKYTFSGSVYFARMQKQQLYSVDVEEIRNRVKNLQLLDIF